MRSTKASLWHIDSEVYLLGGGMVLGMATMMIFLTGFESVLLAMCVPGGVVPGVIAVGYGLVVRTWEAKARKYEEALRALAAYVKPYRRIPLNDLAANTGKTRMQAEQMLGDEKKVRRYAKMVAMIEAEIEKPENRARAERGEDVVIPRERFEVALRAKMDSVGAGRSMFWYFLLIGLVSGFVAALVIEFAVLR